MSKRKQNQVIAILDNVKVKADKVLTTHYQNLAKPVLVSGQTRVYIPDSDDGEKFPPENQNVQLKTKDAIEEVKAALTEWFNTNYTQEEGNTKARADVVVDGVTILPNVPVTYLLFLEKRLVDLKTFVSKLPTLDPSDNWVYDKNKGLYQGQEVRSHRNKTSKKAIVLYEATDKHPAQTQLIDDTYKVGEWSTTKLSSALPVDEAKEMLQRVEKLQKAVKTAREQANSIEVEDMDASQVLKYIFG